MNQAIVFRPSTKNGTLAKPEPNRRLTSVLCRHGQALHYVRPGSRYRRDQADGTAETAEIVEIYRDPAGIPHFRYEVTFEKPYHLPTREGSHVLAAHSFFERFEGAVEDQLAAH
ncbi:MAG: hypothetical protein QNJ94_11725 [Alphaproteobacteria bacterium]|nr:hypothetical protein [Alphaproteobacteria bacterium]